MLDPGRFKLVIDEKAVDLWVGLVELWTSGLGLLVLWTSGLGLGNQKK